MLDFFPASSVKKKKAKKTTEDVGVGLLSFYFHNHFFPPFNPRMFFFLQEIQQSGDFFIKPESKVPSLDTSHWPLLLKVKAGFLWDLWCYEIVWTVFSIWNDESVYPFSEQLSLRSLPRLPFWGKGLCALVAWLIPVFCWTMTSKLKREIWPERCQDELCSDQMMLRQNSIKPRIYIPVRLTSPSS